MVWLKATQVERIKRIWDGFFLGEWMDGPLKRKGMGTDFWRVGLIWGDFFDGEEFLIFSKKIVNPVCRGELHPPLHSGFTDGVLKLRFLGICFKKEPATAGRHGLNGLNGYGTDCFGVDGMGR